MLRWKHSGILQGKKVAVFASGSIAVLCCDDLNKVVHGIVYIEQAGSTMQALVKCLNKIKIVNLFVKKVK